MGIKTKLNSSQVARLVDLLSEGEIEGFPSASGLTPETPAYYLASLKDTFFNNTPVLDATATVTSSSRKNDEGIVEKLNFDMRDARFESRLGKQDQLPLENIDDLNQSTVAVNAEILKNGDIGPEDQDPVKKGGFFDYLDGSPATPVTRQITDTDVTSVRLTIGSPAMTVSKDDGRLRGVRIDYRIEIQYQGAGYNSVDLDALKWLAEQPEPRIWISDQQVVGVSSDGDSKNLPLKLRHEIAQFMIKNNIIPIKAKELVKGLAKQLARS